MKTQSTKEQAHRLLDNLPDTYEYIALNSPIYAKHMVVRITRRSAQIGVLLFSGRRVPEHQADDIRELIENPYRIMDMT